MDSEIGSLGSGWGEMFFLIAWKSCRTGKERNGSDKRRFYESNLNPT